MSDWNLYELEDISWDVFGDSSSHLVPLTLEQINESGSQLDTHKKARHDVCAETRSPAERTQKNEKNIAENDELAFMDGNPNVLEQSPYVPKNVSSMEDCLDGAIALTSTDAKRANPVIDFPKNEQNGRSGSDLLDCEWPDFESFDVDNLFRNSYSTFGEGNSATTNEESWFPPCYDKIDASEDCSKMNFESSCSEMNAFRATSENHGSSNINWNHYEKVASGSFESSNFVYESYDRWLYPDTHNKEDFCSKETINCSNDVDKAAITKNLETSRNSYEASSMVTRNVSISSQATKGKKVGKNLDFNSYGGLDQATHYADKECDLVEPSTQETYICEIHGNPKNFLLPKPLIFQPASYPPLEINRKDASKQMFTSSPVGNSRKERKTVHSKKDTVQEPSTHHRSVQNSCSPSTSSQITSGKKMEESHLGSHLLTKLSIGSKAKKSSSQNASSNQNSTQRIPPKLEKEAADCGELEKASIASFRQLQGVMNQLDIRTKLCIRDGLYRLARNAELRHVTDNAKLEDKVSLIMPKSTGVNELRSTPGFVDMETGTNPIDRSIAHLLFSKAPDPPSSPADDTVSLESRIVNMKQAGAATKAKIDGSAANS